MKNKTETSNSPIAAVNTVIEETEKSIGILEDFQWFMDHSAAVLAAKEGRIWVNQNN